MARKSKTNKQANEVNVFRMLVNDIEEKLKHVTSPRTIKRLTERKEKLEKAARREEGDPIAIREYLLEKKLWEQADKGDVDALMELSIMAGIDKREDWERIKRECAECEDEEGYDEKET